MLDQSRKADAEKNILSYVLGAVSYLHDFYPLHASGVIYKGEAYLFSGHSSMGKSTTVAGLHQRGFTPITDDIANLKVRNNQVFVEPCFPRFRLWKNSLDFLKLEQDQAYKFRSDMEKYLLPVSGDFPTNPIPVKRIYFLNEDRNGEYHFKNVKGKAKMDLLKTHTFIPWLVKNFNLLQAHFKSSMQIANNIEMVEYHRPKKHKEIDQMFERLIAHIQNE